MDTVIPNLMLDKNVDVVKSNDLIEAVFRLSLIELQLVHFCVAWSREKQLGLSPDKPLRFRVSDYAATFGIDPKNAYQQGKDALASLFQRELTLNGDDAKTGLPMTTRTRWISEFSYIDGAGIMSIVFAPKVVENITRLEKAFTYYSLSEVSVFTSYYAARLYELLMQFREKGWRTISIADLRIALGIAATEYPRIANLKTRAIDVAVAQINDLTNWKVAYENHKHGVKIIGLIFSIKPKPSRAKPKFNDDYIKKHARPGESTADVKERLNKKWELAHNKDSQSELFGNNK